MSVKIIFGLGNTGVDYLGTRHNTGAMLLKKLADATGAVFVKNKYCGAFVAKAAVAGDTALLAFCDGYMNNSGEGVKKTLAFFKIQPNQTAVIYDDITLPVGRVKLSLGGSCGGHNGVDDVMQKIGNGFVRIRVGIGAKPFKQMSLADYVLSPLSESDTDAIMSVDIKAIVSDMISKGLDKAQNIHNRTAASL